MKLESQPMTNTMLYLITVLVGGLLMFLARDFLHGGSNLLSGFLLGCMLAVLGLLGFIIAETRTIELDERRKRIVLDVQRRIGGNRHISMPFSEVKSFGVGMQGKLTSGTRYYDLVVHLKSGKEVYLMGGCAFEGRMSRDWIDSLKLRFENAMGIHNDLSKREEA